jgi:hypothetical protein
MSSVYISVPRSVPITGEEDKDMGGSDEEEEEREEEEVGARNKAGQ